MKNLILTFVALMWLGCSSSLGDEEGQGEPREEQAKHEFKTGAEIFSHEWTEQDPASHGGDGLGPMHNDVSCVACHSQGGVGGAGSIEKNAVLVTLDPPKTRAMLMNFQRTAMSIHPSFLLETPGAKLPKSDKRSPAGFVSRKFIFTSRPDSTANFGAQMKEMATQFEDNMEEMSKTIFGTFQTSMVLHKSSTDPGYDEFIANLTDYPMPASSMNEAGRRTQEHKLSEQPTAAFTKNGLRMIVSQRNTPALFGLGKIDRVPAGLLHKIANHQMKRGVVSGRVAKLKDGVGKFGWKGQTASLRDFVRDACANELGLHVPSARQARNPMKPLEEPPGYDLDASELNKLTKFVSTLPTPRVEMPHGKDAIAQVRRGKKVFSKIGCAECHIENLRTKNVSVSGVYSDLLLHDMGQTSADPVPSADESGKSAGGAYSSFLSPGNLVSTGFGEPAPTNSRGRRAHARLVAKQQEWRTPPLWGISATAPYMHDGRASTLEDAISAHGGESEFSAKRYRALPEASRDSLLAFLQTLVPPETEEI